MIDVSDASNAELDKLAEQTDAGQGQRVLQETYDFIGRFVVYPSEHAHVAHALWILHAHLMDRWDSTPRLAFLSPEPASGKSRALEVTERLVPHPVIAVNMTPAYIIRKVGAEEGATILHDEIDTVFGDKAKDHEDIRALLNAGHRRGAVAGRCVVHGKTVTTEDIPAYAAVALAGLGSLPDTILSRSVIIRMRRRKPDEQAEPFRRRIAAPEGERIRCLIELWARAVPAEIKQWPVMPAGIEDRDADVWEPLLAVAEIVGGDWPRRARRAAKALVEAAKETEPSHGILLLRDLKAVFGDADKLATESVLKALQEIEESPWRDLKGKLLDSRGLAKRLTQYGVKSRTVRIGNATPRGYERKDFLDAWARYLPSPATSATSSTVQHTPPPAAEPATPSAKAAENQRVSSSVKASDSAEPDGCVAHVAHVVDFPGREARNGHARANNQDGLDMPDFLRREAPACAQCNSNDGQQTLRHIDGQSVWLHRECVRFWRREARSSS
jgi:Protein of unknown function (DUF3631)